IVAPGPASDEECRVGGAVAANASGARTFRYRAPRKHVQRLKVVLASGELAEFRRTNLEKNNVGYAFAHDPIGGFIGSEGTVGIIVEAELALLPLPAHVVGLAIFFQTEADALRFVAETRESRILDPRCIEYFDDQAINIARAATSGGIMPDGAVAMVYVEQEIHDDLD